jgi:hypothetical protein
MKLLHHIYTASSNNSKKKSLLLSMKKYRIFAFIAFIISFGYNISAETFILQGKVVDEKQEPIELATVYVENQKIGTMTNLHGGFKLTLKSSDSVIVRVSMIGYQTRKRVLKRPHGIQNIEVMLPNYELGEVVVTEFKRQTDQTQQLDIKKTQGMPSVNGNGVEELIATQAGVSTHNELSSQYNVRGGSFDENSVYINNVEVYRPLLIRSGEQEGLSIINPDMVESIGFSAGGFEAKYGDKMSSALDITYKRPKAFEATATASLLGASGYVGFSTKKFSMSNGIRYKTNKYLLGSMDTKGEYDPSFLDYQTYMSWKPNDRWTVDFIGNISENHYNFTPENRDTKFGTLEDVKEFTVYFDGQEKDLFRTYFGTLNITRHLGPNTSLSLLTSAFYTKEQETYDIQGQYWLNQTETNENLGVGTYMEHARNYLKSNVESFKLVLDHKINSHHLLAGIAYKIEHVDEKSKEYEMRDSSGYSLPHSASALNLIYTISSNNSLNSRRFESFIQDTYKFKKGETFFTLNYGLRFSHWSFNKESLLSPRVSLGIIPAFNQDFTFRFATGFYYQTPFYKELRDTTTINGVTYASLNKNIKSQRSIHFLAAMDYRFKMNNRPFKFTAEAYYKALSNLIPYNVSNVKIVYYGENSSSGYATGLDLKLYGEFVPGTDSWISLSLMSTKEKINDQWIPMPTDQRYSINFFFTDYFPGTDKWKMNLKMCYADGLPFGPPHTGIEHQTFRAPAYRRVDIGMSYRVLDNEEKKKNTPFRNIWIGLDILNLFGISNVNSYYWITDVSNYQYAVPNYLTGRQINCRVRFEF